MLGTGLYFPERPHPAQPTAPASSACFFGGPSRSPQTTLVVPGWVNGTLHSWEALGPWDPQDKFRDLAEGTHTLGLDPPLSGNGPQLPVG